MNNFKRIASFFLLVVIFMTHFVVLLHTIDHQNDHTTNQLSEVLKVDDSNLNESCSICDIYLNVDLLESKSTPIHLVEPQLFLTSILQQEDQFIPVVLYFKQSRSPPNYVI